jgi:hypothetical protein
MDAYWRAANCLSVGQIYLFDNLLLREPLKLSHMKPLVVGHWATTSRENFIYVLLSGSLRSMTWICSASLVTVTAASRVAVCVIHTGEEWMIAKTVCRILDLERERKHDHENKKTSKWSLL